MLVPGVSGGTMAILLGIYDDVIHAVSTLTQNPKKNLLLLGKFLLGSLLGIGLFARLVGYLVETYPFPMLYFFLGAVAGGLPTLYKKAQIKKFNPLYLLYIVGGFVIVWLISLLPKDLVNLGAAINWATAIWLIIAGVIVAVALVLPGISASYMLLMLGLYQVTIDAIKNFNFLLLLPLAIGVIGGTLATTRVLENAMNNHTRATYLLIIGFVLASVLEIFPGFPAGWNWLICPLTLAAGFFFISLMSKYGSE
jgi:putative membrane protein